MDYGFILPDSIDEEKYIEFKTKYESTLIKRKNRWKSIGTSKNLDRRSRRLKRFIRKGIPTDLREQVWMKVSGAENQMLAYPSVYNELLNTEIDPCIIKIISADVIRTFPENENFRNSESDINKVKSLENILKAFAAHNPNIGYCQGLNYVVALILLVIPSEEKAFWLFDTLITKIVQAYYIPGMECVHIDCSVFEELIRKKIPKMYNIIKDMETSCVLMCTKWFVCLYVDVVPAEVAIRIFDCLLYEGDKILFRVALTLLKLNYKKFQAALSFSDFAECFKNASCIEDVVNCHRFMKRIFKQPNPLSYKFIEKLRKSCVSKLNADILTQ